MLESYLKIIHKQVDSFMEVIVRRENGEYFDIHDDFLKFTLDGNFKDYFIL